MTTAFAAGDREAGFRWLAKACDERCFEMITLKVDPRFEAINADPRFDAAAQRVGLS
jgi:serine/threonine-protein kinase